MCTAADKAGKAKGQKVKKGPKLDFGHIRVKHQIEMSGRHLEILVWNLGADRSELNKFGNYLKTKGVESHRTSTYGMSTEEKRRKR